MTSPLHNKSILVTGGAGAFGRAFVRRCLDDGARRVAIYSRDEAKHAAMKAEYQDERLRWMVGDVRDLARLTDACRGVDIVVHGAAMKRVETCEADPIEAVLTNIQGSYNVSRAALANRVPKCLMLSTDKASHPNTLYGMTKATAERLWIASNAYCAGTVTRLSASRYGNVLGSTGSVIPTWRKQAEKGKISITDPTMTRFWMTMDDAVNLVILALEKMRGGDVFIPVIGASTVESLAKAVAPDAEIAVTGPRPGEKKHEVLISDDEARNAYQGPGYYVIEPEARTWEDLPPIALPKVPVGFSLRSSTAPTISVQKLREMIA